MDCAARFLSALAVGLQRVTSLRGIWDQRQSRVWLSAGFQRRFGLETTNMEELTAWGLIHPEDHERVMGVFEALQGDEAGPLVLRGVRHLLAPGVWGEFDAVYSRLSCDGVFGDRPAPCGACSLRIVAMRESVAGEWVDTAELLEPVGEPVEQSERPPSVSACTKPPPLPTLAVAEVAPAEPVSEESVAVASDALEKKWRECEEALERIRFERQKLLLPGDARYARRGRSQVRSSSTPGGCFGVAVAVFALLLFAAFGADNVLPGDWGAGVQQLSRVLLATALCLGVTLAPVLALFGVADLMDRTSRRVRSR